MTATPTPLRELLAEMRGTAFAWTHSAGYGDVMDRYADRLEAALSARDETGAVEVVDRPAGGAAAFESAMGKVLRPHISTARERAAACNLFRAWFDYANRATPPASGEADPQNWPQWVKDAVRNANEAGRHAGRAEATPSAASGDDVGYSSADALNPNLRVLRQIAAKMPPSWEREALFHAELDLGMQIRRLAEGAEPRWDDCQPATPPAASAELIASHLEIASRAHRDSTLREAAALIRRLAAVAPAGMVLVPMEPTDEMYDAWHDTAGPWSRQYRAMLAAAPTPPATAGQE